MDQEMPDPLSEITTVEQLRGEDTMQAVVEQYDAPFLHHHGLAWGRWKQEAVTEAAKAAAEAAALKAAEDAKKKAEEILG